MLLTLMFQVTQLACNFYLALRQEDAVSEDLEKREEIKRIDKAILVLLCCMWGMMHVLIVGRVLLWRRTTMTLLDQVMHCTP
jgi:hypothetical protein